MNIAHCTECGSEDLDTSDLDDRDFGDLAIIECNECGEMMRAEYIDPKKVFNDTEDGSVRM